MRYLSRYKYFLNSELRMLISTRYFCNSKSKTPTEPKKTMIVSDVQKEIAKRIGLEPGYHTIPKTREHLLQYQPNAEDLPPRSIKDSLCSVIIPLSTDTAMQEKYISHLGRIRIGRLMEEMDLFAVWICHQHVEIPKLPKDVHLPYTFVTLLVDKVEFHKTMAKGTLDVRLTGHVSWTGRTSMEISIWAEQKDTNEYYKITKATFLMVARNATNTGSAPVNTLKPADAEEEQIVNEAIQRQKMRLSKITGTLSTVKPTPYEQDLMYELFNRTTPKLTMELNKRILPSNCNWMSESFQSSILHSFPEHRNAQNTVFGGFIMRCAVEISWISACTYCKCRPTLIFISDISFNKPVNVDSFIKLTAYVVFTLKNYLQIMTMVDIMDNRTGEQTTSNSLYLTYQIEDTVKEVIPRSFHEALWYLQGRRIFYETMKLT